MSLRSRVALAAVLATVAAVVIAGFAVLAFTGRAQVADLDRELERQVEELRREGVVALLGGRPVTRPPGRGDLNLSVRVLDAGTLLFDSDFPAIDGPVPPGFSEQRDGDERWRVLSHEVRRLQRGATGTVTVQVAASMAGVEATLADLRRLLVLVGALAVAGAAGGGWFLGTVAIRPLAGLRRQAERVSETADLSVRVPVDQGPTEVDDLAHSLNAMLERIEEGSARTQAALDASRGFAGNVAHELRTPLTSMQTNLEVLAANPELPPEERAAIVDDVIAQQRRLLDAFEALRLLARGDLTAEDLFELTDLAELIDGTVAQARARFPEATVEFTVGTEPPLTRVWPEGMRVLLDNLIRNAVTHGAGVNATPRVLVSLDRDEAEWVLAVEDDGEGIPIDERERVLERFVRGTGARATGSGLGLALVVQQAEAHGGAVSIEDAAGGGARLEVRAPLRPAQP